MATTLEQIVEQIKTLTDEEQQRLRTLLDIRLAPTPEEQERRFAQHLLAIGMIDHIPEGHPEGYVPPPPVIVQGEPVSETIIRERR